MKLNVQQMKEKFGVSYCVDSNLKIKEIFNIQITSFMDFFDKHEDAVNYFNKAWTKKRDNEIATLERYKETFHESSFLVRNSWRIKNKRISFEQYIDEKKEEVEKKYIEGKNNPKTEYINPQKIFNVPDIGEIKASSVVYLVAEAESSQIPMGVYEAQVIDFYYFMRDEARGLVDISGQVAVKTSSGEEVYGLRTHNDVLDVNRMGISIFTKLEDAITFNEKNMKKVEEDNNVRIQEMSLKLKP